MLWDISVRVCINPRLFMYYSICIFYVTLWNVCCSFANANITGIHLDDICTMKTYIKQMFCYLQYIAAKKVIFDNNFVLHYVPYNKYNLIYVTWSIIHVSEPQNRPQCYNLMYSLHPIYINDRLHYSHRNCSP